MFIFSSLIEKFKSVKDFRSPQGKRHKLHIVLTIIMISMLGGHTTYKQSEQFIQENQQKLIKCLNLVNKKLPSYSTIRRVMMGIKEEEIIASKNDYLITVKRNQIKLFEKLESLSKKEMPLSISESIDNSHGRKITRRILVFSGEIVKHKNYPHLKSFIKVIRSGKRGEKKYEETVYYISSQKLKAEIFAEKIKDHWLIENQVHWVKDVIEQ